MTQRAQLYQVGMSWVPEPVQVHAPRPTAFDVAMDIVTPIIPVIVSRT